MLGFLGFVPGLLGCTQLVLGQLDLSQCKLMPGDSAWPDIAIWNAFNASVNGRLIQTVPIASVCHGENYDPAECENVRAQWHRPAFHEQSPSSIMSPIFLNKSCDPFTDVNDQCIVGEYVQYSVNVSRVEHVIRTIEFAKKYNIRFVVKNTGHDYMGKSTGAGGLAVWMHQLTERVWYPEYNASHSNYRGPAVKAYAGVIGSMLIEDAEARGLAIVAGQSPTVGFVGGYVQGGGHSILSSLYGMAADQVLEFEVITTEGQFVRASATENTDLFWALRGGGGGTYGIVWSVTVKAYPDMFVTTVRVSFQPSDNVSLGAYWEGINAYLIKFPIYLRSGACAISIFDNTIFQALIIFPKMTEEQVTVFTKPWFDDLRELGINPSISTIVQHPTVQSTYPLLYEFYGGEITIGANLVGSRLLPQSLWETEESRSNLFDTMRDIADEGVQVMNLALNPTLEVAGNPANAVLPAFRSMQVMSAVALGWNDAASWDEQFSVTEGVRDLMQHLERVAPNAGAYLNEADPFDPEWKKNFYGTNYQRLLEIKDKWDPSQLLYGSTAVGGDRWITAEGGRLCRQV